MFWHQKGYWHEVYVEDIGLIVGEVEYRTGANEFDAFMRVPKLTGIGSYLGLDKAKAAVERAYFAYTQASAPQPQQGEDNQPKEK